MSVFMVFGPVACAFFCGALFLSVSIIISVLFLSTEEIKKAYQMRFLNISLLTTFSIGILMLLSTANHSLGYLAIWLLGALFGGIASLEIFKRLFLKLSF